MSNNSLQTAQMRPGDFHLRRDDRQMFGNFVVLSAGAGTPPQDKLRRSAMFIETPVYEAPKLWRLDVQFQTLESSPAFPLSPWVPPALGGNTVRVTVRQALDRDKQTAIEIFDLRALTNAPGAQCRLPKTFFAGQQIGVSVESIGNSFAPMGTQVSLVEVTAIDEDAYGNATPLFFPQAAVTANFLTPNKRRRQFFIQNLGSSPLYLAFDFFASIGLPHVSMILPNRFDIYESPRDCYQGYVSGVWAGAGGATDGAAVTEGF